MARLLLFVLLLDSLYGDTRQYATRIFPILDPVTGARREAHPPSPTFEQRWLVPVLTGKDFNWVVDDRPRTIVFPRQGERLFSGQEFNLYREDPPRPKVMPLCGDYRGNC